ncbi:DUF262 domain-containing protein [Streptomyces europaeiscabiei]|uniref:DUF262 domain-containing protein n=1 Tax=Streptomyces europaeiscabiei TaxID=146819 RepID=UPI000628575D|nr:DUF262 domain-containing protein [Streptomyces europaeiscabiei]
MAEEPAAAEPDEHEDPSESEVPEESPVDDSDAGAIETEPVRAEDALRYFGADFDVDGLVKRLDDGTFIIPTFEPLAEDDIAGYEGFQRGLVWKKKQMDRFIESILLGYPVPGIFLVELSDRRYLVLDGQQRLSTFQAFKHGKYWTKAGARRFSLRYVGDDAKGATYETLDPKDRRLFDNTFIQATIVVPRGPEGRRGVYSLFERINSGGTNLKPQQIRVALYAGATVNFVRDLNKDPNWRAIFGEHNRDLKDHELILRAIALIPTGHGSQSFRPPMAQFLNNYLELYQDELPPDHEGIRDRFTKATALLREETGEGGETGESALRIKGTQVNAAHTDAVLVGLMTALENGTSHTPESVATALSQLKANTMYQKAVAESTSHADQVRLRIRLATAAFQGEPLGAEQE